MGLVWVWFGSGLGLVWVASWIFIWAHNSQCETGSKKHAFSTSIFNKKHVLFEYFFSKDFLLFALIFIAIFRFICRFGAHCARFGTADYGRRIKSLWPSAPSWEAPGANFERFLTDFRRFLGVSVALFFVYFSIKFCLFSILGISLGLPLLQSCIPYPSHRRRPQSRF